MNWTTLRNGLLGAVAVCIAMWIAIFFNYYETKVFAFAVALTVSFYDLAWIMDKISKWKEGRGWLSLSGSGKQET